MTLEKMDAFKSLVSPNPSIKQGLGKTNIVTMPKSITLNQLLEVLLTNHAHRAWIVSSDGNSLLGVVSMSDIISYICRRHQECIQDKV